MQKHVLYDPIQFPHVTAVIPAYNEEKCIGDCIHSLQNQDFKPIDKGPGAARNSGAKNATGNILLFVDADMTFEPDYVGKLIRPIVDGFELATCHWHERVANWNNPWARCQTWFLGLPDKHRQPIQIPLYEEIYRAVRKDFFLSSGGYSESEGRGDDSSIFRKTGVKAKIVTDAICAHHNFKSLKEVLFDSIWHGRNVVVSKNNRFKRIIVMATIHKNPILEILRGLFLAFRKTEHRMIPYAIIYTLGFYCGVLHAAMSSRYSK